MIMIGNLKNESGSTLFKMYESHADARHRAFRVHYHTELELSLIISGSGTYNADGRLIPVEAGDIFFYKSSVPHCMSDISEGGMDILNIHISPSYFQLVRSASLAPHFGRDFLRRSLPGVKLSALLSSREADEVRKMMLSLREELVRRLPSFELAAESRLAEILVLISRKMTATEGAVGESSEAIFRALEFIDAHYTEQISLDDLAKHAGLEKTYFATLFKRTVGTNPWEYVLIKRIDTAIELLRSGSATVLELAVKTGFNNTANFNKIFKKYTGTTPKEIRKRR